MLVQIMNSVSLIGKNIVNGVNVFNDSVAMNVLRKNVGMNNVSRGYSCGGW